MVGAGVTLLAVAALMLMPGGYVHLFDSDSPAGRAGSEKTNCRPTMVTA